MVAKVWADVGVVVRSAIFGMQTEEILERVLRVGVCGRNGGGPSIAVGGHVGGFVVLGVIDVAVVQLNRIEINIRPYVGFEFDD